MGEKVLVTGATGFAGGHLAHRLAQEGHQVRALVRKPERAAELARCGIELCRGDVRDARSVGEAMAGVERVYHIAALFRQENVSRQDMFDINAQGTKNVLEAARQAGVRRLVHCSTVGVHGDVENPPANENSPYHPGDHYQESKLQGELYAQEYMADGRLPVTIFRPAGMYGPGDLRFLKLVKSIKRRRFAMIGSGNIQYQMIYADDLVDGILLCGTVDRAVGNIYLLANDEILTLNQLVYLIADVLQVPPPRLRIPFWPVYYAGYLSELIFKPLGINPPLYRRRVDFFRKTRAFDISKARKELGFQPKICLKTGLQRTAAWYQQEGAL